MIPKRVFILTYDYLPNNGGIARLCFEIKKNLEKQNIPVTVLCLSSCGLDLENDKNVVRISGKRGIVEFKFIFYLKKNSAKDDIILTGTFHPDGLLGLLSGRKVYMLAHGAELLPGKTFFRKRIWSVYRNIILKKADKIIANSHYTEGLVKKCSHKAKSVTIPLAVDANYFHPTCPKLNDGLLHLSSISRLERFKGHDFILKTIAALPNNYKEKIRFRIGGKGSYKVVLEQIVKDLHLSSIVIFDGFVSDTALCDFYSSSDVFILCTREEKTNQNVEGFGLVFTEAQACGTPTIGTRTGGIPDAIKEDCGGWLIEQDSQQQLQDLLIKFIDNPEFLRLEGVKARQRILVSATWDHYVDNLCKVIFE